MSSLSLSLCAKSYSLSCAEYYLFMQRFRMSHLSSDSVQCTTDLVLHIATAPDAFFIIKQMIFGSVHVLYGSPQYLMGQNLLKPTDRVAGFPRSRVLANWVMINQSSRVTMNFVSRLKDTRVPSITTDACMHMRDHCPTACEDCVFQACPESIS